MQLDLSKLASLDPWGALPGSGALCLFFNPLVRDFDPASATATSAVLLTAEELNRLELRECPPMSDLPEGGRYYYEDFLKCSYELRFEPAFSFGFLDELPRDFVRRLEDRLEIAYVQQPSSTVFGKPITWQGEGDLFEPADWDWAEGSPPDSEHDRVLLFQTGWGEGTFHFWVKKNRSDKSDFTEIETTASVT